MSSERRTSFTCYPVNAAAAYTVSNGWLKILSPALNTPVQFTSFGEKKVTAQIVVHRSWSVVVGDILQDLADDRVYLVQQTAIQSPNQLLWCEEIRAPLPDEFNTSALKAFWTSSNVTVSSDGSYIGSLVFNSPQATALSSLGLVYQLVAGDFDVYVRRTTQSYSLTSGESCYQYLLAREASTGYGVAFGEEVARSGASYTTTYKRWDLKASGSVKTTITLNGSADTQHWRLRREGELLTVFVAGVAFVESYEQDGFVSNFWNDAGHATTDYVGSGDLRVGLASGRSGASDTNQVQFYHLRNWYDSLYA